MRTRFHGGGVNFQNLRALEFVSNQRLFINTSPNLSTANNLKMALINARSISNKTFILNDFISSRKLDFMFVTETWLNDGDLDYLSETSPSDFNF